MHWAFCFIVIVTSFVCAVSELLFAVVNKRILVIGWMIMRFDDPETPDFQLKLLGFQKVRCRNYTILVNEKEKIVLKLSYRRSKKHAPVLAIPTLVLHEESDFWQIVLQPLADASDETRKRLFDEVDRLYGEVAALYYDAHGFKGENSVYEEKRRVYGYDFHAGNIALWNGQPVMIDW